VVTASAAKRAEVAARRTQAIRLRIAGADWQVIADSLGYRTRGAACQDVTRAMEANVAAEAQAVEVLRQLQVDRQDRLIRALWPAATGGALDPEDEAGKRYLPPDPQAAEIVRKLVADQVKTLGVAALPRMDLSLDSIDEQIARLNAQMAGMG
jgi:hypothetical protein